jgi:hypothetical protein
MTDNPFDIGYQPPVEAEEEVAVETAKPKAATPAGVQRLASAAYHADPAPEPSLSATLAKLLLRKSPRHAWTECRRLNPDWQPTDKKTFDIGRAAHRAVLGAGDDYVAIPVDLLAKNGAASTSEAKNFIERARMAGQTPLKEDEIGDIEAMRIVAHARLAEHGVTLDPERSELCAIVQIEGIWCRAMCDNVPADPTQPIYDFKTCEDATPEACLRSVLNYGYDIQAEHYRAVWKAATGEDRDFVFIFQEKSAPYEVTLVRLSGSFRHLAERRAAKARAMWAECITTNNWPGYPVGMNEVDPPAWLIEREFQEEAA